MWLKIYDFIIKARSTLGDGAEISLSVRDGFLIVRVDFTIEDYHAISEISEMSLMERDEELMSRHVTAFVEWCRKKRDNTQGKVTDD